jgi:hypothetical protein
MCVAGHSNENRHPKPQFVKPDMARAMNPAREVTFPNDQRDEVPPASFVVQFFPLLQRTFQGRSLNQRFVEVNRSPDGLLRFSSGAL